MVLITIVTGAYKPTYNWVASHCTQSIFYGRMFPGFFYRVVVAVALHELN